MSEVSSRSMLAATSVGSNDGALTLARTRPVRLSSTTMQPLSIMSAAMLSQMRWMRASSVSMTPAPVPSVFTSCGCARPSVITAPTAFAAHHTDWRVYAPSSRPSNAASRPDTPVPSPSR